LNSTGIAANSDEHGWNRDLGVLGGDGNRREVLVASGPHEQVHERRHIGSDSGTLKESAKVEFEEFATCSDDEQVRTSHSVVASIVLKVFSSHTFHQLTCNEEFELLLQRANDIEVAAHIIREVIKSGNKELIRELVETGVGKDYRAFVEEYKREEDEKRHLQEQRRASNVLDGHPN
jgi:hypothetical protein